MVAAITSGERSSVPIWPANSAPQITVGTVPITTHQARSDSRVRWPPRSVPSVSRVIGQSSWRK
jgi:hypothetical protein